MNEVLEFNGYVVSTYDLLLIAAIVVMLIGLLVQVKLKSTFKKYSRVRSSRGISADVVARNLVSQGGCNTQIEHVSGDLTDHFDPKANTVRLSDSVYGSDSIAALAVAAHEIGHVMQHKEDYLPIKIRNTILPVANIGSTAAPYLVIIGLILGYMEIAIIGVYLFAAVLAFQLVTLPVEFNASSRAIRMLTAGGYIESQESPKAKKVLRMAAMTYVVATLSTLVSLLRLMLIVSSNRRRD